MEQLYKTYYVPGTVRSILHLIKLQNPKEVDTLTISILQRWKLRHRKASLSCPQSRSLLDLNPDRSDSNAVLITLPLTGSCSSSSQVRKRDLEKNIFSLCETYWRDSGRKNSVLLRDTRGRITGKETFKCLPPFVGQVGKWRERPA